MEHPRVAIVHNVHGRTRYEVAGLYRSIPFKLTLETMLMRHEGIASASASHLTGNVTVTYNSYNTSESVAALIAEASSLFTSLQTMFGDALSSQATLPELMSRLSGFLPEAAQAPASGATPSRRSLMKRIKQFCTRLFDRQAEAWHTLSTKQTLMQLNTDQSTGLSAQEAEDRLKQYGPNMLSQAAARSKLSIFVDQFKSLPTGLLGVAAVLSACTGGILDAVLIAGVMAANAWIGTLIESEAERTIASLQDVGDIWVKTIRDGKPVFTLAEHLVIGDIVSVTRGSLAAADCRMLHAESLSVDESLLTGESLPVYKTVAPLKKEHVALADRTNMLYMGTMVTGGAGLAVVVATGKETEVGRLKTLLDTTETPQTPIQRQLEQMGTQLVIILGSVCGGVFALGLLRGYGLTPMIKVAAVLAAAAVPEGLPAAATINFALGVKRMRAHHVLVRHLPAVETLGALQTVCLDKTGTITENRMAVVKISTCNRTIELRDNQFLIAETPVNPTAFEDVQHILHISALCNEAEFTDDARLKGSSTENALLHLVEVGGLHVPTLRQEYPLLQLNQRAENRNFMVSLHHTSNCRKLLAMKGSPAEVLARCQWHVNGQGRVPLTDEARQAILTNNAQMAGDSLRVLGFAYEDVEGGTIPELNTGLTWVGLVGMTDPIRKEVKELIRLFHSAGIETVMITGDQNVTAYAVAKELEMCTGDPDEVLDSSHLVNANSETLRQLAHKVHVYARVSPAHKLKIVQALQACGKVVAMTGDGVNDGPALKAANLGIAMGENGANIAKEVADIVLEKDNLETLAIAVRDGRTIHQNLRKSVHFFLSTNFSEVMLMSLAVGTGIGFPLNTMQLLWINVISDIFPGLALSMEAPENDIMAQPPRDPNAPLFSTKDYQRMATESAVITSAALGAYGYGMLRYGLGAQSGGLAFQTLALGQLLHALSCRSERHSLLERNALPPNKYVNLAVGGSIGLQALTMFVPGLRNLLGLGAFGLLDLLVVGGSSLLSLMVNETLKKPEAVRARLPHRLPFAARPALSA